MIVRWQKEQEYFIVRLYQDLVGDWILSQSWGDRAANEATVTHTVLHSYTEARRLLSSIARQKRKLGYRLTGRGEEQLGFDFN